MRVVTLSTLFPNEFQPTLGGFVANQTLRLAACQDVELRVINPVPVPPFPLNRHPRYRRQNELPLEEQWQGCRVARPRLRVLPGLSGRINPWLVVRSALPILKRWWAEGFKFDVIDAEFFFPDGPAAARLADSLNVAFSIKARGADIHYWGKRPGCREQILAAAAKANGLLAVSESLRHDMIAMGMDAAKTSVHYTGVDLDRFQPVDRKIAKAALGINGKLVVSLGALIPRKGHHLVIEAVAGIPDANLLVIGEGSERPRLTQLVRESGLTARVRLLGNLPHEDLPAILAAADVMALASESEGLANAWVESMACGTPVVAPDVDAAGEAIDRPAAGRLVKQRTAAAIREAICAVLSHPPSQEAVRASAERFSWQANTSQLQGYLSSLLKPQAAAGQLR